MSELHHFRSSNLASAKRTDDGKLRITFQTGAVYDYDDVPADVEQQLYDVEKDGGSSGAFFAREIKNVYVAKRVS